jgi:peptidoglycan/xylan/chitin deacetylase (PgdA/CDA1 family)
MSSNPRVPFRLSSARPAYAPPQGRPLIVHIVVNIENWIFGAPMPRKILTAPHGVEQLPDVPNFAWVDYGMRCGLPRLIEAIAGRGLAASCAMNAGVVDAYRPLADAVLETGWELVGHGMHQRSVALETDEAGMIAAALGVLRAFSGQAVRGWLSPGLRETDNTPDLLRAQGVDYCADWALDDLPSWMTTKHGPMLAMPYSLEINDSVVHTIQYGQSDTMLTRLQETLSVLERESRRNPRVITLGLHPHLIAVPHRFRHFEQMLDLLTARDDVVFMSGGQIADWYAGEEPAPDHLSRSLHS